MAKAFDFVWQTCRDARGVAAVEAAITIPVLLMFILGLFEFSMVMRHQAAFNNAVSAAARYATLVPSPTAEEVRNRIFTSSTVALDGATVTVTPGTSGSGRRYYHLSVASDYRVSIPFAEVGSVRLTTDRIAYIG